MLYVVSVSNKKPYAPINFNYNDKTGEVEVSIDKGYKFPVGNDVGITRWSAQYGVSDLSVATLEARKDAISRTNAAIDMINEEID